jgi:uncharacterized protein (DUF427 family)
VTVADSGQPRILFETGLPPRYYLPLSDVRLDLLQPSATRSHCPYKGTASYWSVDTRQAVHSDVVWIYRTPLPESQKIAGLACFYNEKIDLYLDGVLQERAQTKFSCRRPGAQRADHTHPAGSSHRRPADQADDSRVSRRTLARPAANVRRLVCLTCPRPRTWSSSGVAPPALSWRPA